MNISELKTSEGRAHIIGQIALIYSAIHGFIPADLAAKISLIGFTVYSVVRGIVKAAQAIAAVIPALEPAVDKAAAEVAADAAAAAPAVDVLPAPPPPVVKS